jgi:glucosylceramidase
LFLRQPLGATADPAGVLSYAGTAAAVGPDGAPRPRRDLPTPAMIALAGVGAANAVRNWVRCIMFWNVVLDEFGNPNIGPMHSIPLIVIDSKTREIIRGGDYWAMKHYNHAARRGARRFETQGELEGVAHVAFVNPDDTKTVVLSNTGAARKTQLRLGHLMTEVSLPASSVTNLSWI